MKTFFCKKKLIYFPIELFSFFLNHIFSDFKKYMFYFFMMIPLAFFLKNNYCCHFSTFSGLKYFSLFDHFLISFFVHVSFVIYLKKKN